MWRLSSTTAATVARPQLQLPSKQAADGHWKPKGRRNSPNIYIYTYIYDIKCIICWRTSKMGTGRWGDGRGIYHRRWDIQDGNWQVGRREEEFTTWHGTSKMGTGRWGDGKRNLPHDMGLPRWNWQVGRREEEFTTGDGTSKMGTGR